MMNYLRSCLIGVVFVLVACSGLHEQVMKEGDFVEKEEKIISQVIHNCIGWAKNKDRQLLLDSIRSDESYFVVNPEEGSFVKGYQQFATINLDKIFMDPRFKAVSYNITDLKITLSESRTVAWFSCMLDDFNEWDGQPANWENVRWTGVLEKQAGKWRIAQMHFSYGRKR